MKLGRNLLAGLASSAWTAIVSFLVVPFYLNYLGIEAYGLIGFFVTLQAILQLLDMGLAPAINREVARCSARGELTEARTLLHSLAYVYWLMAVVIGLTVYVASPLIADLWLDGKGLAKSTVLSSVVFMGLVIACRWPVGLYAGALMGAQRLAVSSSVNIVMVTVSNFGAVGVLAFASPSLEAFFAWQACSSLVYALVMRQAAWTVLQKSTGMRFDFRSLKRIWRFSAGMGGVAVLAVVLLQIDKVVLSKLLSLEQFGHYTLATVLSSALYVLLTPLFNTIYPYMTLLLASGKTEKLVEFYRIGTRLFLTLMFPLVFSIAVFSNEILFLWTRDQNVADAAAPIVSIFIFGTAINGVMHFPYALQLSHGNTSIPLNIQVILIVFFLPATIILANAFGTLGGALSWLLMNIFYLILGSCLTHRSLLKGIGVKWILVDVGGPLFLAMLVTFGGGLIVQGIGLPYYVDIVLAAVLLILNLVISISISHDMRRVAIEFLKSIRSKLKNEDVEVTVI